MFQKQNLILILLVLLVVIYLTQGKREKFSGSAPTGLMTLPLNTSGITGPPQLTIVAGTPPPPSRTAPPPPPPTSVSKETVYLRSKGPIASLCIYEGFKGSGGSAEWCCEDDNGSCIDLTKVIGYICFPTTYPYLNINDSKYGIIPVTIEKYSNNLKYIKTDNGTKFVVFQTTGLGSVKIVDSTVPPTETSNEKNLLFDDSIGAMYFMNGAQKKYIKFSSQQVNDRYISKDISSAEKSQATRLIKESV